MHSHRVLAVTVRDQVGTSGDDGKVTFAVVYEPLASHDRAALAIRCVDVRLRDGDSGASIVVDSPCPDHAGVIENRCIGEQCDPLIASIHARGIRLCGELGVLGSHIADEHTPLGEAIVLTALTEKFKKRNPQAAAANERAFKRGAEEYEVLEGVGKGEDDLPVMRPSPVLGYETAPIGGVIPFPGNTVSNDLSTSRTGWMPLFTEKECIHCGLCATVCPDFCLTWSHERTNGELPVVRLKGVDYQYCKGCMRCVETCPTEAMVRVTETPGLADSLRVPLYAEKAPAA